MIRRLLVSMTIGGLVLAAGADSARADEIDMCANAYESAQRHHKAGELKTSIADAQTCARDVCPEILKKDCSGWVTAWRAEEKEKERERAAREPPPPAPVATGTPPPAPEPSRPVPTMTYVLGGVGLLALGGATGFALNGVNIRNDLDRQGCAKRGDCDQSDVDRARTRLLIADVLGVAGALAVAGAIVFYVTRPDAPARPGSVAIIPALGGAFLRTTF
jgi:hypothetical protein